MGKTKTKQSTKFPHSRTPNFKNKDKTRAFRQAGPKTYDPSQFIKWRRRPLSNFCLSNGTSKPCYLSVLGATGWAKFDERPNFDRLATIANSDP
jgi:hypothetical protein